MSKCLEPATISAASADDLLRAHAQDAEELYTCGSDHDKLSEWVRNLYD